MSTPPTRKSYREAKAAYLEHANGYEIGQAREAGTKGAARYAQEIAKGLSALKSSVDEHVREGLPAEGLLQTVRTLEGILAEVRAAKGQPVPGHARIDDLFIGAIEELQKHTPGASY